jgi:hypothetical protein
LVQNRGSPLLALLATAIQGWWSRNFLFSGPALGNSMPPSYPQPCWRGTVWTIANGSDW